METFLSFTNMVRRFKGDAFIDPGSRAMMHHDHWYIMGEAGTSLCSPYGFRTQDALRETVARFVGRQYPLYEPNYLPAVIDGRIDHEQPGHWDRPLLEGSIVLGRDIFHFWASNHPEQLVEFNREMLHG